MHNKQTPCQDLPMMTNRRNDDIGYTRCEIPSETHPQPDIDNGLSDRKCFNKKRMLEQSYEVIYE